MKARITLPEETDEAADEPLETPDEAEAEVDD
jgi:hypothetical protein